MATRQNSYLGPQFRITRGATQGGIASPTLLHLVVDSVVFHWLFLMVEYESVI